MAVRCNRNYEAIWDWHPEMILVSESPVTWKGFLIVSHSSYVAGDARCSRVKLKLAMPDYPSFDNAQIAFGRHIALLRNREFSRRVKDLMTSAQTVLSFFTQLQSLVSQYMLNTDSKSRMIDFKSTRDFLQDVRTALQNPSNVQLSSDRDLNTIKLSLRGVSLTLQRCNDVGAPWKVVSSDMPAIPTFEKNVTNLSIAMTKFKWQVELLERAWEQLREIDENCWVIDPPEPNKSHMYRRIHLSQSLSVTITIDPLNPTVLQSITFSGSDNEVKRQKEEVNNNLKNWNRDCNILENLRIMLNTYEFPEQQESMDDSKGIIGSRECGICFSEKSETDELPHKICNNERCMKHFHSACLSRWLQMNAENQVVFGHIYGNCPHCKEKISCPIE
ncbi:PREDICTED: E3 ubiquitin-protein ligase FANCL [Vollenhovia emeryi]|uniref:E3 ubiquitin-protein ligase FANCL n=1 Tax=Vollenhovia emeryi TaxID=411798 RepID=UPI0005F50CBC|nr:PREDICTED: E3 ubiquitin-protein ligase FANCL [Vollenhovia emeryi]XP_011880435.1 PREDICTED: E3 ubiquitin-protein ligase FANCL [Vollenhovia emeryi]XP_011880436.1 PREDICTED: E3 ubiquitin-protein ligase FANCL [Vollenhovia emeryi]XP_011880437.1 PREDICTED: E3 ubiquitin-protein ligase FANCL [Vollenhovia emeryi]